MFISYSYVMEPKEGKVHIGEKQSEQQSYDQKLTADLDGLPGKDIVTLPAEGTGVASLSYHAAHNGWPLLQGNGGERSERGGTMAACDTHGQGGVTLTPLEGLQRPQDPPATGTQ